MRVRENLTIKVDTEVNKDKQQLDSQIDITWCWCQCVRVCNNIKMTQKGLESDEKVQSIVKYCISIINEKHEWIRKSLIHEEIKNDHMKQCMNILFA